VVLAPFEVQTAASTGYGAQYSSSSSRLNLRYVDVPQSVSVITSEFLRDAFIYDSRDFVKYVPNIQPRANTHQPETFYIRGLQVTDSYVDGYIAPFAINRDAALYDRIEYVKGPASAAMGRGEAGGLVNFVSKLPLRAARNQLDATIGTDAFYRLELDHGNRLTADGRMSYRIPAYFEDSDSPRGGALMHSRKHGIGPSFAWDITPRTKLVLNGALTRYEGPGPVGEAYWQNYDVFRTMVALNQINPATNWNPLRGDPFVPKDRVYGWAGKGRVSDATEFSALVTHKFNDALSVRQAFRFTDLDEDFGRFALSPSALRDPADPGDFLLGITFMRQFRHNQSRRAQGDLLYETKLGPTSHQFLAGYDLSSSRSANRSGQRGGLTQKLYKPSYDLPAGFDAATFVTDFTTDTTSNGEGFGYYAQYSGAFFRDRLHVMYGWRKDETDGNTYNRRNNTITSPGQRVTDVPRYSISYKPVNWLSLYYVHSEQADPTSTVAKYGNFRPSFGAIVPPPSDPRYNEFLTSAVNAKLDEIGVKASLLDERVTASFAVFELVRNGFILNEMLTETGANGIGTVSFGRNFIVNGEGTRGFEFELFGQPTRQLTLVAGIAAINGDKPFADGRIVPIEALIDSAMLNVKYDFRDAHRNGFEVSAGGKLMLKGWVLSPGTYETFRSDQYILDAGASYSWNQGRYSVRFRANNLTDQFVFISGNSQLPLRRLFLSFSTRF
jgi:outer membrane receptor for ferric coprogen and ferric-rhodotorulic acid